VRTIAISLLLLSMEPGRSWAAELPVEGASALAHSEPAVEVHFEAPPDCPTLDTYLTHVEARLGPDWKSAVGQFAKRVEVMITRAGDSYRGSIEFVNAQGERFSRSVSGEVCIEVVNGLGLMTELAVKSRVREQPPSSSRATESDPSRQTQPSEKAAEDRAATAGSVVGSDRVSQAKASPGRKLRVRVGARASLTTGVGPDIAFGPGAFAALELTRARVGIGIDRFEAGEVQANAYRAAFRLLSGRLEGCPWSFELQRWATLEPCAIGELGSFRAAPRLDPPKVTVSEPQSVIWGALGVLGRLVLHRSPFLAELEIIGRAPLRRERFFVETEDRVVFRIPAGSVGAAVGLGLSF
jgi:hypothetical protein